MKTFKNIFVLIFSFVIVAYITYCFSTQYFDEKVNDFFISNTVSKPASDDIVLVIIDDKSIAHIRWPWHRNLYTDMFEFLQNDAKAKLIIYDAIIVSPDNKRTDQEFFNRLSKIDRIIAGFDVHSQNENISVLPDNLMPLFESKFHNIKIKDDNKNISRTLEFKGITNFLPQYLKNINSLGSISVLIDSDGVLRKFSPIINVNNKPYPSIALVAFSKLTGIKNYTLSDKYLCSDDNCKSLKVPLNYDGTVTAKWYNNKNYDSHYTHKKYSAIDIINSYHSMRRGERPIVDLDELENKIVVVGAAANAHALEDIKSTPVLPRQSGSDTVATFLDNMLHNEFARYSTFTQNVLIYSVIAVITFILILKFSLAISAMSCACIFLIYFINYFLLIKHDFILPLVTTFLIQIIAMLFCYSYRFIVEDTKKKQIQKAMGKYISDDIMKNVVKNIEDVKLGGKRAELTILFADIRGFTSISERLTPEEVTEILNEYFSEMEPIISKYKGVLNKFIGDAILVIFGDPIYDKDHAINAVKCADSMLKRVKYLQSKWENEGKPKIEIGVGINTGEAFVGNIGSQNRLEYTVIGDSVNLANRIEGYNKVYKTRFLISHTTYQKVRDIVDVIKIKDVSIRGKAKKIDIYEVLKLNDETK